MKESKNKQGNSHYLKILAIVLIAVAFYVLLGNLGKVKSALSFVMGVLTPIIIGLCLAFIFNLPMKFFEEVAFRRLTRKNSKAWKKLKRPVCLSLSIISILSVITVLIALVLPQFINACVGFFIKLPEYMEGLNSTIRSFTSKLNLPIDASSINIDWNNVSAWALKLFNSEEGDILSQGVGIASALIGGLLNFVLGFALSIYILASKESLIRTTKSFIYASMKKSHAKELISIVRLSNKAFSGFLSGQCIEVLTIGVLCFVGMLIFRFPFALMVSCVIAFTAFIPVFGPFIGTAVGAFLILLQSPIKAIWFVIFIIILQQFESNIIYPKIMGKSVGLPGIWVLVAVTIGGNLFGVFGIIISVPLCSVLYTLIDRWIFERLKKKGISQSHIHHGSADPVESDACNNDGCNAEADNDIQPETEASDCDDE